MLKSSKYKLLVLLSGLFIVTVFIKSLTFSFIHTSQNIEFFVENDALRKNIYFIGSSRIKQSINPHQLKGEMPENNFINLGMGGCSFSYNYILARQIIPLLKPKDIIFIELSGLRINPPNSYFFSWNDILNVIKSDIAFDLGSVYKLLLLHDDFKGLFFRKEHQNQIVGFQADKRKHRGTTSDIVKVSDFVLKDEPLSKRQKVYLDKIKNIIETSKLKNINVIFIQPLMMSRSEKKIIIPLYRKLSGNYKWIYSQEFISSMDHNFLMTDNIHLNQYGAAIYTQELLKEIIIVQPKIVY